MMKLLGFVALTLLIATAASGTLPAVCNNLSSISYTDLKTCIHSVQIDNSTRVATLDTIKKLFPLYGFKDIVTNSPPSGPFVHISIDIEAELNKLSEELANEQSAFYFYQTIQDRIFAPLHDAHTLFTKPTCFNTFVVQPFIFGSKVVDGSQVIFVSNLWKYAEYSFYNKYSLFDFVGKTITSINGKSSYNALTEFSAANPFFSKDPSVNFNVALSHAYVQRNLLLYNLPETDALTFNFSDGTQLVIPWFVIADRSTNLSKCNATAPFLSEESENGENHMEAISPHHRLITRPEWSRPIERKQEEDKESESQLGSNGYYYPSLHCSAYETTELKVHTIEGGDDNTLILRISGFTGQELLGAIQSTLDCGKRYNMNKLILDMRSNGGGLVCSGVGLVNSLRKDAPPALYDFRHSQLLDALTKAATVRDDPSASLISPGFWMDPSSKKVIQGSSWYDARSLNRGNVTHNYTKLLEFPFSKCFSYTPKFYDYKIVIVTDGFCGSTCAITSSLLRLDDPNVVTVAVGGLSNQTSMSFSTFPGGIVEQSSAIFKWIKNLNVNYGSYVPSPFTTTAAMSFSFSELYHSLADQMYPEEFSFLPADHKLDYWPSIYSPTDDEELYRKLQPFFPKGTSHPLAGWKIALIIGGVALFVVAVGIIIFVVIRRRRAGYQAIQ